MSPQRRLTNIAVVVVVLTRLVAAALPDCALRCVTIQATTTGPCDIDHLACICTSKKSAVLSCIPSICESSAATDSETAFNNACALAINSSSSSSSSSGSSSTVTTSSTAESSGSSTQTTDTAPPTTTSAHSTSSGTTTTTSNPSNPASSGGSSTDSSSTSSAESQTTSTGSGDNSSDTTNSSNDSGGGSSTGSLVGAILGGLIGGLIVVAAAFFFIRRKRNNRAYIRDDDGVMAFPVDRSNANYFASDRKQDGFLMDDISGPNNSTSSTGGYTPDVALAALPEGARAPSIRGAQSIADSSYAARPLMLDSSSSRRHIPRKGDLRPFSYRGPTSESGGTPSMIGSSSGRDVPPADNASSVSGPASASDYAHAAELAPHQLDAVQAMVNSRVPAPAVVSIIQQMLKENQDVPPEYSRGPGSVAGGQTPASGSGSR